MPDAPSGATIPEDEAERVQRLVRNELGNWRQTKIRLLLAEVAVLLREDGQEPDFDHVKRCDRCKGCPHRLKTK